MFKALLSQASALDSACLNPLVSLYSSCVDVKALSSVDVKALSSVDVKALSSVPKGAYGVSRALCSIALCSIRRSAVCTIHTVLPHPVDDVYLQVTRGLFRGFSRCLSWGWDSGRGSPHASRLTPHASRLTTHDSRLTHASKTSGWILKDLPKLQNTNVRSYSRADTPSPSTCSLTHP